jgi:hypothetical protein
VMADFSNQMAFEFLLNKSCGSYEKPSVMDSDLPSLPPTEMKIYSFVEKKAEKIERESARHFAAILQLVPNS